MTMILANLLDDRSAGFVITDTRATHQDGSGYVDCGGKMVPTEALGWACVSGRDGVALASLLQALRDASALDGPPLNRLELIAQGAFLRAGVSTVLTNTDKDTVGAVLEMSAEGPYLAATRNAAAQQARTIALAAGGSNAAVSSAVSSARGSDFIAEMRHTRHDLATRIQVAAEYFVAAARDSRSISADIDVGYIQMTDNGPRRGFLQGSAQEIAAAPSDLVLARFAAPDPTQTVVERLRAIPHVFTAFDSTGTQVMVDPEDLGALSPYRSLGTTKSRAKMQHDSAGGQSVPNNTQTPVAWDSVVFDVGGLATLLTGRLTIPADSTGLWLIHVRVEWNPNGTGFRQAKLVKNSSAVVGISGVAAVAGSGVTNDIWIAVNDPAAGDYFTVDVTQNSGGALSTQGVYSVFEAFHVW